MLEVAVASVNAIERPRTSAGRGQYSLPGRAIPCQIEDVESQSITLPIDTVRTADGIELALTRMPGTGRSAVLLIHGLTANRVSFHLDEAHSMARELAKNFQVFMLELRGHGRSQMPRPRRWSVEAYIHLDVPAAIHHILALPEIERLHAIGHSMGGIILLSYTGHLAQTGKSNPLASLTTIGSSLFYRDTGSLHEKLLKFKPVGQWLPYLPMGAIKRLISPFIGRSENAIESFYYHVPNMKRETMQTLFREGFDGVPPEELLQLATLFDPEGFSSWPDHRPYGPGLKKTKVPVHAVYGALDKQCPPLAAQGLRHAMEDASFYETVIDHYGHFDLVLGEEAPKDVFPRISQWLQTQDQKRDRA